MAQINRFYLLIAALVFSKTYDAAAIHCDSASDVQVCADTLAGGRLYYSNIYKLVHCNSGWYPQTADGDPIPGKSYCEQGDFDLDEAVYVDCCRSDDSCLRWYQGNEPCENDGSGGGQEITVPTCSSGYYLDETTVDCVKCPNYSYYAGTFTGILGGGNNYPDIGTDSNISQCYIPAGKTFVNNSGTYEFVSNCYYGS